MAVLHELMRNWRGACRLEVRYVIRDEATYPRMKKGRKRIAPHDIISACVLLRPKPPVMGAMNRKRVKDSKIPYRTKDLRMSRLFDAARKWKWWHQLVACEYSKIDARPDLGKCEL